MSTVVSPGSRPAVRAIVGGALAVLVASSAPSAAADVLVFDACVGTCSGEQLATLRRFRQAIARERPDVGSESFEVLARLGHGTPLPAITDPDLTAAQLTDRIRSGLNSWADGQHERAAEALGQALLEADRNPGIVMNDPSLRQLVIRARIGRTVSLIRLGRGPKGSARREALEQEAIATIGDLVRSTPAQSIVETWGTEADAAFQRAREELVARGEGGLVIEVDDPGVTYTINEEPVAHTGVHSSSALPGLYRVFARDRGGRARRYLVEVRPGARATLKIEWRRDTAFVVSARGGGRLGFAYASDEERSMEPALVRYLGARGGASTVVVAGHLRWNDQPHLFGVLYDTRRGAVTRAGVVPLEVVHRERDALRQLAAQLLSPETPTPLVRSLPSAPWDADPPPAPEHASPPSAAVDVLYTLGFLAGIGGVVGLGTGVALELTTSENESGPAGAILVASGVGVAIGATTLLLYRRYRRSSSSASVVILPRGDGVYAAAGWRF